MLKKIFHRVEGRNRKENKKDDEKEEDKKKDEESCRTNSLRSRLGAKKRQTAHQIIIKQGYLVKFPEPSKLGSSLKRAVKKWLVFGSLDTTFPFLDCYTSEEACFTGVPEDTIDLRNCLCLLSNQKYPGISENVFTIVMSDKKIMLGTNSRTAMQEWCCSIERYLKKIGILDSIGGENDYLLLPPKLSQRVRSLPPLPLEGQNEADESNDEQNYQSTIGHYDNLTDGGLYLTMLSASERVNWNIGDYYIQPNRSPSELSGVKNELYLNAAPRECHSSDEEAH